MGLNKQKGNMYPFVTHTWNPIRGKCPHDCVYCYMKVYPQPELHFAEKELETNLGNSNFIFVGSSTDMWAGYLRDNGEHRYKHPTQKPQKIFDYCINKASEGSDLILDPFLGSGTTAFCAKKLNRKCIGIEIEEKYCEIAANRCRQEVMDLTLQ